MKSSFTMALALTLAVTLFILGIMVSREHIFLALIILSGQLLIVGWIHNQILYGRSLSPKEVRRTRLTVFWALTSVLLILSIWFVLGVQIIPEQTIGIVHRGHRAFYTLPAEYELPEEGYLSFAVGFGWIVWFQGALPILLSRWEDKICRSS